MNAYLYQLIIATPILIIHIVLAVLLILRILNKDQGISRHFKKYGMVYGLIIALAAMIGSLGFSEGFHYPPCKFCWLQRIFHYPQLILFAVALKYRDMKVWTYSLWLSVIGLAIGTYQILMQFSPEVAQTVVCNVNPSSTSCSDILSQSYGYITIPVMSVTLFLCLIVLYLYQKRKTA